MGRKLFYRPGSYYVTDDRTGFPQRAERTRLQWNKLRVDENVWEPRQAQDLVKGVKDKQSVPDARPLAPNVFVGPIYTPLSEPGAIGDLVISVDSTYGFVDGGELGVMLDSGVIFNTTVDGTPGSTTVTMADALPDTAAGGNLVVHRTNRGHPGTPIPPKPVNTVLPEIAGAAIIDSTLSLSNGSWDNSPVSYARRWLRNSAAIPGAIGPSYLLVLADLGQSITGEVTATNAGGSTAATSTAVVPIAVSPPVNTTPPAITGSLVEGGLAALSTGIWTNSPTAYTAQWFRGAAPIAGALGFTYVWQAADVGQNITAQVTATNDDGSAMEPSNTVVPTAAPAGIPIASPAALQAMFAAGVGASGGKTYLLAGIDFGNVYLKNHDFSSDPIIIAGQAGTQFASLVLDNMQGSSWSGFNAYGAYQGGNGVEITNHSAHLALDAVTSNSQAAWGTQSGGGIRARLSSFITINGRRDATLSDITGRNTGLTLLDCTDCTVTNLTLSNIRSDGIRPIGCNRVMIDGNLGFSWFPQPGDHQDWIQWYDSALNANANITISNNGWIRVGGGGENSGAAQGYFGDKGTNFVISGNYAVGCLYNGIARSGGAETQIDDNFIQGFPDYAAKIIVRNGSVDCSVTDNSAQVISNYAAGGVNPGFTPIVLPGSNTIIGSTPVGNFTALDAWLLTHPLAPARPE